jgi:two-component system OmpR family sensor kinase
MSLRARLLLGFVAIALVLVAADVVLAVNVQRSLIDQIDQRLEQVSGPFNSRLQGFYPAPGRGGPPSGSGGTPTIDGVPSSSTTTPDDDTPSALTEFFFVVLGPDGTLLSQQLPNLRDGDPAPRIDGQEAVERAVPAGRPLEPYTVGAEDGSSLRYRVAVQETAGGELAMVGIPMREADATLSRLIWVEVAATAAVLVVLGLVAFWVIRLGLRPIERMTATADAIAEGDLSKRVEAGPSSTEAGRLGLALNGMLHQIEGAFDERQASEDRLRRFIADASHELRTPLTSIRGYTELYRSGAVSEGEGLTDAMRRIEGESVRMGVLVDDMLLLARLDQGRPIDAKPVDLAALARDSASDAHAVEPERPITLDVPPAPVIVAGDEQRLRQVLANLLANARQHTSPDTPVLVKVSASDGRAVIEVADRGPGIDVEDAERIFERFYRADPSRTRQQGVDGGAGLGLSIVAAVAAAHHGQASVETAPGHGARFLVELPLTTAVPTGAASA